MRRREEGKNARDCDWAGVGRKKRRRRDGNLMLVVPPRHYVVSKERNDYGGQPTQSAGHGPWSMVHGGIPRYALKCKLVSHRARSDVDGTNRAAPRARLLNAPYIVPAFFRLHNVQFRRTCLVCRRYYLFVSMCIAMIRIKVDSVIRCSWRF